MLRHEGGPAVLDGRWLPDTRVAGRGGVPGVDPVTCLHDAGEVRAEFHVRDDVESLTFRTSGTYLIPAHSGNPPQIPRPGHLPAQLLALLNVDPTQTPRIMTQQNPMCEVQV